MKLLYVLIVAVSTKVQACIETHRNVCQKAIKRINEEHIVNHHPFPEICTQFFWFLKVKEWKTQWLLTYIFCLDLRCLVCLPTLFQNGKLEMRLHSHFQYSYFSGHMPQKPSYMVHVMHSLGPSFHKFFFLSKTLHFPWMFLSFWHK